MICPSCKDEFRPGFTHCANCDVDLVESLDTSSVGSPAERSSPAAPRPASARGGALRDALGFVALEDARAQRDRLRAEGIRSEIAIRESPDTSPDGPIEEEYWLCVEASAFARALPLLEYEAADEQGPAPFACDRCGHGVDETAEKCPKCGARFDD